MDQASTQWPENKRIPLVYEELGALGGWWVFATMEVLAMLKPLPHSGKTLTRLSELFHGDGIAAEEYSIEWQ